MLLFCNKKRNHSHRMCKLYSHYKNYLIKIKEKIYCDYLKKAKEKTSGHFKIISYCSHGKRKKIVETVDKEQMIEHLASASVVPTYLMPIKKKSPTKQLTTKLDAVKKVDNTLEALEDREFKEIANLHEKVEKEMELDDDDIFENTSSTVWGQSPSNSSLSSSSFASHAQLRKNLSNQFNNKSPSLHTVTTKTLQTTSNENSTTILKRLLIQLQEKEQPNVPPPTKFKIHQKTLKIRKKSKTPMINLYLLYMI